MLLQRIWVFDASNSGVAIFEMGGGHIHMDSTEGGEAMKEEDEWGEDTSRSRKMGGVYLSEEKNGGSIVRRRKKCGEYTYGKKKMGGVHTCGRRPWHYEHPPPLRMFLAPSLNFENIN